MVEAAIATTPPAAVGKAKAFSKKPTTSTKPVTKATHPPTSEMVNAAVGAVKDRKGVSFQAIKKYIGGNYIVDVERLAPFVKKYLKQAVKKNVLVQTSGFGAVGRFKLAKAEKKSTTKPASEEKKTTTASKKSDKPKSPSKAKKSGKAPAMKAKSPKPKSVRN